MGDPLLDQDASGDVSRRRRAHSGNPSCGDAGHPTSRVRVHRGLLRRVNLVVVGRHPSGRVDGMPVGVRIDRVVL